MQGHNSSSYGQSYDNNWSGASVQQDGLAGQFDMWQPNAPQSTNYSNQNMASNDETWKINRENALNDAMRSVNMSGNPGRLGPDPYQQSSQYSFNSQVRPTVSRFSTSQTNQYYNSSTDMPSNIARQYYQQQQQYQQTPQQYQPRQPQQMPSHNLQQQYPQQLQQQMPPQQQSQQQLQQMQQPNYVNSYASSNLRSSNAQSSSNYVANSNAAQSESSSTWSTGDSGLNSYSSQNYKDNSNWNISQGYSLSDIQNAAAEIYTNPLDSTGDEETANSAGECSFLSIECINCTAVYFSTYDFAHKLLVHNWC